MRSSSSSNKPSYSEPDGNDEYNNAATRQIRRRVFRVAMERGVHDERRKKLASADADVGGPSLNTKSLSPRFPKSPGSPSNGYQQKQHSQSFVEDHEGDMPLTPGTSTTPKALHNNHHQSFHQCHKTHHHPLHLSHLVIKHWYII